MRNLAVVWGALERGVISDPMLRSPQVPRLRLSSLQRLTRGRFQVEVRAPMSDLPLFLVPPQAPRSRQQRTATGRRAKIGRGVKRAKIARIRIRRTDNDGREFRTSFSLDRTVFDIAALIWGGEEAARLRLVQLAEATWAADNRARHHADTEGRPYSAAVSVSRFVQAAVIADAATRLRQLRDQGHLPLVVPARGSTARGKG